MEILKEMITIDQLKTMATDRFGNLVKAIVDVDRELVALNGELHSDLEDLLLKNDSQQRGLWGVNLYPDLQGDDFVEFDSMTNMRPSQGNMSRGVDDERIRQRIIEVINKWIKE